MSNNKKDEDSDLKSLFSKAQDEVKNLGEEVLDDAHELKDELIKYGKNRLIAGGTVAFKGAIIGSAIPGVGTKIGAVGGFCIGFFGGPKAAEKAEKWFARKESANDNSEEAKPKVKADEDNDQEKPKPPSLD